MATKAFTGLPVFEKKREKRGRTKAPANETLGKKLENGPQPKSIEKPGEGFLIYTPPAPSLKNKKKTRI